MGFKRFYKITKLKITRVLDSNLSNGSSKMNSEISKIYAIVRAMCKNKGTKFLIAPVSGTYYLQNKDLDYYIILGDDGVRITNHKFFITKSLTSSEANKMVNYVRNHIENIRRNMEKEIFANESTMINEIYENLKKSI
jgi:hypothetical protein